MRELGNYAPWKESLLVSEGLHNLVTEKGLPEAVRDEFSRKVHELPAEMARLFNIYEKHEKIRALSSVRRQVAGLESMIETATRCGKLKKHRAENLRHKLLKIRYQLSSQLHMLKQSMSAL